MVTSLLPLMFVATALSQPPATLASNIVGTWVLAGLEVNGQRVPEDTIRKIDMRVIFSSDGSYSYVAANRTHDAGEYRVDETTEPHAIDLTAVRDGKTETYRGIFAIRNDWLRMCCHNKGEQERPREFTSEPGSEMRIGLWKRIR